MTMSEISFTITLRDKLSSIVKKHEPKVLVIGGVSGSGDVSKAVVAMTRLTSAFGMLGVSFSSFTQSIHKTPSCGFTEANAEAWKFESELLKSDAEKWIKSLNKLSLEVPQPPIIQTDTSPKSFGMKKMGINNNKNFKRKR